MAASGGSKISQGGTNLLLAKLCWKLHENEKELGRGGGMHPKFVCVETDNTSILSNDRESGTPLSNETVQYMSWFMGARRFPRLVCLAMVHQARAYLVTSAMLLHHPHNILQMAASRVVIWLPLDNGGQHLRGCRARAPPKFFYKKRCVPHLLAHFWFALGWDTSWTATLAIGAAEHLLHINKEFH